MRKSIQYHLNRATFDSPMYPFVALWEPIAWAVSAIVVCCLFWPPVPGLHWVVAAVVSFSAYVVSRSMDAYMLFFMAGCAAFVFVFVFAELGVLLLYMFFVCLRLIVVLVFILRLIRQPIFYINSFRKHGN